MPFLLPVILTLLAPQAAPDEISSLQAELTRLRSRISTLEATARERDDSTDALRGELKGIESGVTELRSRPAVVPSQPFMAAPPPSSDAVGVAKTVVFAPRVEADTTKPRDLVILKVRRVDPGGLQLVGERELASEDGVDLPVDQNGALYVVEWSTAEGQPYNLILRDGTSGLAAATAHVRLQQIRGKFIYVGYRAE
jgi:hypothetical protein